MGEESILSSGTNYMGAPKEKRRENLLMSDRLDEKILASFQQLSEENQRIILDFLAAALSGPAASASDRR